MNVEVKENGKSGIFATKSNHGIIFNTVAIANSEVGIEIDQSECTSILENQASENVVGIALHNSLDIMMGYNESTANTAGMLASVIPAPNQSLAGRRLLMAHNIFNDNNKENSVEEGSFCSAVPKGIGVMLLGYDFSHLEANQAKRNEFVGIGAVNSMRLCAELGYALEEFDNYQDPYPNGNIVVHNIVTNNGNGSGALGLPVADLLWDNSGDEGCWMQNEIGFSSPVNLNDLDTGAD
jgi:parallel beta-helix repeat protein